MCNAVAGSLGERDSAHMRASPGGEDAEHQISLDPHVSCKPTDEVWLDQIPLSQGKVGHSETDAEYMQPPKKRGKPFDVDLLKCEDRG